MRRLPFIFAFIFLVCLMSCRSIIEVPVETIVHDTTKIVVEKVDSFLERDSIIINKAGDTIYETRYKYVYRYKLVHDTLYKSSIDTVTQVVEVEKNLSKWQQFKLELGGYLFGALLLIIAYFVIKIFIR